MINTRKHLAYTLKVQLDEIENIIRNIDKFYYEKEEIKKDKRGQPKVKNGIIQKRVLNPSVGRLKVIQKRIQNNILHKLDMPDYAFGGIRNRDNILNAQRHKGKKYNFTTDLKNFYPSIRHAMVFEMFRSFSFSPTVARYLTQLTTFKGRLPQGTPTSPMIANLVFVKTGKKLALFARENQIVFTSFVDDLTFSAPADFKEKIPFIIDSLVADGFKISHNKTFYKTKNPIVTGLVVKNNKVTLPESFKIRLQITEGKTQAQVEGLKLYADRVAGSNSKPNKKNPINKNIKLD